MKWLTTRSHEMVWYLLVRGGTHTVAYAKALEALSGVNVGKLIPIPDISNKRLPEAKKHEAKGSTVTGGMVAKKSAKNRSGQTKRTRPAAKRDLVRRPTASAYTKRSATGRFKEMDDVGRSQRADKRRKAKKTVKSGYGDQGDTRPRRKSRGR